MAITSISTRNLQKSLTAQLQSEQSTLSLLATQLSSQKKFQNLTDYAPRDARNLVNLQSVAAQRATFKNIINTVNNTLSVYDSTLTDLESLASQAQSLATNNPTYDADIALNLSVQANNLLKSAMVDLNQQLNGRYLYSGSRYTLPAVQDLSALPASSLSSTIITDQQTVTSYDYYYQTLTADTGASTIEVSGNESGEQTIRTATITLGGTDYVYTIPNTHTTAAQTASYLATQLSTIPGVTATVSGSTTINIAGLTVDDANMVAQDTTIYATDAAAVDSGYVLDYGITSNDPSIQKLIAGLRYLQAAGNSANATEYQSNISQATVLLTDAVTSLQAMHTTVASNMNIISMQKKTQEAAIEQLTNQIGDIQQVDLTQVSTEITILQTILQASYSVTGNILKMSIINYL